MLMLKFTQNLVFLAYIYIFFKNVFDNKNYFSIQYQNNIESQVIFPDCDCNVMKCFYKACFGTIILVKSAIQINMTN